jgi:hypothetical protein
MRTEIRALIAALEAVAADALELSDDATLDRLRDVAERLETLIAGSGRGNGLLVSLTWSQVIRRDNGEAQLSIVGKGDKAASVHCRSHGLRGHGAAMHQVRPQGCGFAAPIVGGHAHRV